MLKTMRKNVKSLKPTLWIIIATFIIAIFAVWGGAGGLGLGDKGNRLATVGRDRVSSDEYTQALRTRLEALKKQLNELNSSIIQQFNIPQQVLQQMVDQSLLLQIAGDMGLKVTDEELRDKIVNYPVFQREGKFIGLDEYRRILQWNRIPLGEFEASLKKEILMTKTIQVLTAGIPITDEELWENYKKDKETAKIEYLVLEKDKIEVTEQPDPVKVQGYFEKNKDKYKIPEKRSALYVFFKTEDLKKEVQLTDADIDKYYKDNISQFKEPEKVKISRIQIPFTEKDKPVIQSEAQNVLNRINAGEDFAALARKSSKDAKAKDGGDWGLYEWKSLSAKETGEIQKLDAGKTSGLIEIEGGFSILKVTEKEPPLTKSLPEVKTTIKNILEDQKARNIAAQKVAQLEKVAKREKSLDFAAQKEGLKPKKTGLVKESESIPDIDPSGTLSQTLFSLKEKEISTAIYTYGGVGIAQLEKIEAAHPAKSEEVKEDVQKDLIELSKKDKALEKINEVRAKLKEENWEQVAKEYKLEYKTVNEHKREQYLGVIGENAEVDTLAFSLPPKEISRPVEFANGYVLMEVLERKEATKADFEKNRDTEKTNLLETKRNKFLQSYIAKVREEKGVKIKYDLFLKLTSDITSRFTGE
jgi:peptidyl-prolyl cis-trans isomerase D